MSECCLIHRDEAEVEMESAKQGIVGEDQMQPEWLRPMEVIHHYAFSRSNFYDFLAGAERCGIVIRKLKTGTAKSCSVRYNRFDIEKAFLAMRKPTKFPEKGSP